MQSGIIKRNKIIVRNRKFFSIPISLHVKSWLRMLHIFFNSVLILILLPFLTSACLTTKPAKVPAFRGLTPSEADRLQSQNDNDWRKSRPAKAGKG